MPRINHVSALARIAGAFGLAGASAPAFAAGTLLHGGSVEIDVNGVVN